MITSAGNGLGYAFVPSVDYHGPLLKVGKTENAWRDSIHLGRIGGLYRGVRDRDPNDFVLGLHHGSRSHDQRSFCEHGG